MTRSNTSLVLAIALVVAAGGCQQRPPASPPVTGTFSITYPDDWVHGPTQGPMRSVAVSPMADRDAGKRATVNVIVKQLPKPIALAQFVKANKPAMSETLTDFESIEERDVQVGGTDAMRMEYKHTSKGMRIHALSILLTDTDLGYVITCAAAEDDFQTHLPQFEQIISTFELK